MPTITSQFFDRDGSHARDIKMPVVGSINDIRGKRAHDEIFIDFQSYLFPPTILRYDFATEALTIWREPEIDFFAFKL